MLYSRLDGLADLRLSIASISRGSFAVAILGDATFNFVFRGCGFAYGHSSLHSITIHARIISAWGIPPLTSIQG